MTEKCTECGKFVGKGERLCESCKDKYTDTNHALASQSHTVRKKADNQPFDDGTIVDFMAAELKKDINYLMELGIKLDKGKLAAKTGGLVGTGASAFTGHWLAALVIGGGSLLLGGLTNGYKQIKLQEVQQKWFEMLSEMNEEQLEYLATGLQQKYPLLVSRFQSLLQADKN